MGGEIVYTAVPWWLWLPLLVLLAFVFHRVARRLLGELHQHGPWVPFICGLLVGAGAVALANAEGLHG